MNPSNNKSFHRYIVLYVGIILFLVIALFFARYFFNTSEITQQKTKVISIGRQNFKLHVTERGLVRPARITPVKSKISSNQAKLIWVLEEGIHINKGLLIARFDTKPLMDILERAEQQLADSAAQYEISLKALELLKEANKSKIESSQRELEIAGIKSNDLKNGSGPLKRKQLNQIVKKSARLFKVESSNVRDLLPLLDKGHITRREYEKAENDRIAAQEALQIAQAELQNFDKYEWPRIVREAEVINDAAVIELARVQRTAELEQQQQRSKIEKNRRDLVVKKREFNMAKKEVAACDVYAPTDGILLYSLLPYEGKKRKIQIGDSIWAGQTFLEIPDTTELTVEINIREIDVAKLSPKMPAEINLDAYPSQIFAGELLIIDSLAQKDDNNTSLRRFFAKISFCETNSAIRVGMSATVRIIYKELSDVLAIPTSAISYHDGRAMVRKSTPSGEIVTEVIIGDRGIQWVEILKGLNIGDSIIVDSF